MSTIEVVSLKLGVRLVLSAWGTLFQGMCWICNLFTLLVARSCKPVLSRHEGKRDFLQLLE